MSDRHGTELKPGTPVLCYRDDDTVVPAMVLRQDGQRYQIEIGQPTGPRSALPWPTVQAMLNAAQAEIDAILRAAGQPPIDIVDPCWVDGSELEFLGNGGAGVWGLDDLVRRAATVGSDDKPCDLAVRLMTHIPRDDRRLALMQSLHQYVLDEYQFQGDDGHLHAEALDFLACIVLVRVTDTEVLAMTLARLPRLSIVELVGLQLFLKLSSKYQRPVYILTCQQRREWVQEMGPKWRAKSREVQHEMRVTSGRVRRTFRKIASKDLQRVPGEDLTYAAILLDMMYAERCRDPDFFDAERI
jgi:hypothetical protein